MTAFVESCVETVAGSAHKVEVKARGKPRAKKLLALLAQKTNVLITTHEHPDPDALASAVGLATLLQTTLKNAKVTVSIKGQISGGVNAVFVREAELKLAPWDDAGLKNYDAILLVDVQPMFAFNPLPAGVEPIGVIDHHRGKRGRKLNCPFCDVRTDVGATASIIFSYFMELEVPIKPALGATLLYAIESDLAGAAGTPGELDNMALSSLTLIADTRKLYQMRYVDLPQSYYVAYAQALNNAVFAENALLSHLDTIDSLEQPAVMADFLLRFDKVQWALMTTVKDNKLILSLRTSAPKASGGRRHAAPPPRPRRGRRAPHESRRVRKAHRGDACRGRANPKDAVAPVPPRGGRQVREGPETHPKDVTRAPTAERTAVACVLAIRPRLRRRAARTPALARAHGRTYYVAAMTRCPSSRSSYARVRVAHAPGPSAPDPTPVGFPLPKPSDPAAPPRTARFASRGTARRPRPHHEHCRRPVVQGLQPRRRRARSVSRVDGRASLPCRARRAGEPYAIVIPRPT
jgi:nanoRNase/pAp phosphatase (c-di-AMP/oligoRNAs hydrolase)